jgi:hypothetical protein
LVVVRMCRLDLTACIMRALQRIEAMAMTALEITRTVRTHAVSWGSRSSFCRSELKRTKCLYLKCLYSRFYSATRKTVGTINLWNVKKKDFKTVEKTIIFKLNQPDPLNIGKFYLTFSCFGNWEIMSCFRNRWCLGSWRNTKSET